MAQEYSKVEFVDDDPDLVRANKQWNEYMNAHGPEIQKYRYANQLIYDDYEAGNLDPDPLTNKKLCDVMLEANRRDYSKVMDGFDRCQDAVVKALAARKVRQDEHKKMFPKHDITQRMIDDTLVDSLHPHHEESKGLYFTDVGSRKTKEDNN